MYVYIFLISFRNPLRSWAHTSARGEYENKEKKKEKKEQENMKEEDKETETMYKKSV
jgi:hypothetical protein